jgi:hypothetical protein
MKVFENRGARRVFEPKRDETTGDWTKLRIEELHNLYSSPNIIRMIKSRRRRWTGHVARIGRNGLYVRFWWESQKEEGHEEYLDTGGRIILKWTVEKQDGVVKLKLSLFLTN